MAGLCAPAVPAGRLGHALTIPGTKKSEVATAHPCREIQGLAYPSAIFFAYPSRDAEVIRRRASPAG
jgi:hypothetical protein